MKPYPHTYSVSASASAIGIVSVVSPGLPLRSMTLPAYGFCGVAGQVLMPNTV
jgi:hypothetical protein